MQFAHRQYAPHSDAGSAAPGAGRDAGPDGGRSGPGGCHKPGGRLNLLLSTPRWQPATWAESLPRLLEPQGVASHWAPTARDAERLIRSTAVHMAVVDLRVPLEETGATGVPEDGGPRILELLSRLECPPPTVVIRSATTQRDQARHLNAALRCGAFSVVDRTAADLELMLQLMQRVMSRFYQGRWPAGGSGERYV